MSHFILLESYFESDAIGKAIFLSLAFISVLSWTLLIVRLQNFWQAKKADRLFLEQFEKNPAHLLLSFAHEGSGPTLAVFESMQKHTLELLRKNRQFGALEEKTGAAYLSMDDIHMIAEIASSQIQKQIYQLELHVYHLSTIATLGPFLGLFGTVWGILTSFQSMTGASSLSSQLMFMGLSMALATTVVGLIVAIPAFVGHNTLRGIVKQFEAQLNEFSSQVLSLIELQYRKVEKDLL